MTKQLGRHLVTVVLLAVFLTVAGSGPASARGPSHGVTTPQVHKPVQQPGVFSGDPDQPVQGSPIPTPKTSPSSVSLPNSGDLSLWIVWWLTIGQFITLEN